VTWHKLLKKGSAQNPAVNRTQDLPNISQVFFSMEFFPQSSLLLYCFCPLKCNQHSVLGNRTMCCSENKATSNSTFVKELSGDDQKWQVPHKKITISFLTLKSRPGWYCTCSLDSRLSIPNCLIALRLNLEWKIWVVSDRELDRGLVRRLTSFFFAYTFWTAVGTSSWVHCIQSATDLLVSFGKRWQMGSLRKRGFCLRNWAHDPFKTSVFLSAVLWTLPSTSIPV